MECSQVIGNKMELKKKNHIRVSDGETDGISSCQKSCQEARRTSGARSAGGAQRTLVPGGSPEARLLGGSDLQLPGRALLGSPHCQQDKQRKPRLLLDKITQVESTPQPFRTAWSLSRVSLYHASPWTGRHGAQPLPRSPRSLADARGPWQMRWQSRSRRDHAEGPSTSEMPG